MKKKDAVLTRFKLSFWGLKNKMLFSFTITFLLMLSMLHVVRIFGVPFLNIEGEYDKEEMEVFNSFNLVADLKKKQLLLWLNERREEAMIIAKSKMIQAEIGKFITDKKGNGKTIKIGLTAEQKGKDTEAYQRVLDYLLLVNKSNDNMYDEIQIFEIETGNLLISTLNNRKKSHIMEKKLSDFLESGSNEELLFTKHEDVRDLDFIRKIIITQGKKRVELILIMHINANRFMDPLFLEGRELGNSGEVLLIDNEFNILTPLKYEASAKINRENLGIGSAPTPMTMAALGQQGTIKAADYRGKQVLAVIKNIRFSPELRWGMVVKKDLEEVYLPIRESIRYSIIIGVTIFLFSILVILFISNNLTTSIKILMETAVAVKEGNFSKRAMIRSKDEIGFLAVLFNNMVELFQNWNSELEKEITIQTSALNEQTDRLEQYVYTASHDIKSPLINIQGYSKLMCDTLKKIPQEEDKQKEWLSELQTFAMVIKEMVDKVLEMELRLLEYAKTRSLKPVYENILLKELLKNIVHEIQRIYSKRNPEIKLLNIPEKINYNSAALYTILSNLLINAIKCTPIERKPEIKIYFSEHDFGYECSVKDNGIGIKKNEGDRIFDLFVKLNSKAEGYGVGLAIVRNFVEKYGGKVSFKSKHRDGATFIFTLPGSKDLYRR